MDTNKTIKKLKTFTILNIILYAIMLISLVILEENVFTLLFPDAKFKGLSFFLTMLLVLLVSAVYFTFYFLIQMNIANILKKQCDPINYKEVYFALSPKNNPVGKKLVEITAEFMRGNFDLAKTLCFDVIKNESNINLKQNAYIVLSQIFLVENDVENLNYLRQSANILANNPKLGKFYAHIAESATVFIEFLVGDPTIMLKAYENARQICKNKCDLYLSLYYYALALLKTNNDEKAVNIFEELMNNANGLFVAQYSKLALLYYATGEMKR